MFLLTSYSYECRAQNPVTERISLLYNFDNLPTCVIWAVFVRNGFVAIGVEFFCLSRDALHAFRFKDVLQLALHQFDALSPRSSRALGWAGFHCALQVIQHRQI